MPAFPVPAPSSNFLAGLASVSALPFLLWYALRFYLYRTRGCILALERVLQSKRTDLLKGNAVIAGGSIGGLLAARICHDHFERVIIVEPEGWLTTEHGRLVHPWTQKQNRKRVMQYKSIQGVQAMLFRGLQALFPGLEEEARRSKMIVQEADFKVSIGAKLLMTPLKHFGGTLPSTFYTSRQGLETFIRRLVLGGAYNSIEQVVGTVVGVVPDPSNAATIQKVVVRSELIGLDGTVTGMEESQLDAALVIDCTGVARAGLKWLQRAGYGERNLDTLRVAFDQKLHYSTQTFALTPELVQKLPLPGGAANAGPILAFLEDSVSEGRRFLGVSKSEGERLHLFAGHAGIRHHQPRSLAELRRYVSDMRTFGIAKVPAWFWQTMDMLEQVEDTKELSRVRVPGTSYIRYEKGENLPNNFVALGDAVMTVNPLFAQGCTKVLFGVLALNDALLRESSSSFSKGFARRYFVDQAKRIGGMWEGCRINDYGLPDTDPILGENTSSGSVLRWYIRRLQILGIRDEQAALAVFNGAHAFGTDIDAFHPWLICKVVLDYVRRPGI